ncbi:putative DNA cytosine methylase [Erwinia phage pEa_SNUABM_5]|uniref:DNA (cytosine-5-)-methyltransferase n=1 Tax=Erwinia phage pEa_SNUABM_5 TaxID=2797313 RepID=A0A7T8EPB5_9CAUD|nr:putative DNA cytosine methylase [Erwinia phage pEa_SNUABM_5]QQO90188.1 putative DNA cytosine methylase [Erwinia phage pEa_SNUABM_5]
MLIKPPKMKEINDLPKLWSGMSFFAGCGGSSTGHKMSGVDILVSNEFIDIARETYAANHPTTKVLGQDIRRLSPDKILKYCGLAKGELDLLDGSPPCFLRDTLIHTQHGMRYIDSIETGDMVMTHEGRYRPVVQPMRRPYSGPLHRIQSTIGQNHATPEHPFYVRRLVNGVLSEAQWVDAREVRAGDKVATPIATPRCSYEPDIAALRKWGEIPEFWWLCGHWVSNGFIEAVGGYEGIRFITPSNGRVNQLMEQALETLGFNTIQVAKQNTRYIERFMLDDDLCQFLKLFLTDNEMARQIQGCVFHLDMYLKREFIYGFMSRCSATSYGKALVVQTRTERFMTGMKYLIASAFGSPLFDLSPNVTTEEIPENCFTFRRDHPFYPKVRYTAVFYLDDTHRGYIDDESAHVWVDVLANEVSEVDTEVFNFSVDTDETYIANNTVVHNCKGFSTAGVKEDGWGKEVKYSDNVYQQVDDLFDEFCRMLGGMMPKVFTAENVSGLTKGMSKGYFLEIMATFDALGYHVRAPMLNSSWLGVPQSRERIIFMGVRKDIAKKLKLPANSTCVPSVIPHKTQTMLADALPHIAAYKSTQQDLIKYKPAMNGPMPTITAADAIAYETARFSSAGFIELLDGTRRKLTINELLVVSGMPSDYKLLGKFEEQWERLGRVCVPAMTHNASKVLIEHILIPYCNAMKKRPGEIFR